jgi:hypothetical protein
MFYDLRSLRPSGGTQEGAACGIDNGRQREQIFHGYDTFKAASHVYPYRNGAASRVHGMQWLASLSSICFSFLGLHMH